MQQEFKSYQYRPELQSWGEHTIWYQISGCDSLLSCSSLSLHLLICAFYKGIYAARPIFIIAN
jgi:hypothetical protein